MLGEEDLWMVKR